MSEPEHPEDHREAEKVAGSESTLPVVEYSPPAPRSTGQLLMGIFGGVFGYLGLMVVTLLAMGMINANLPVWVPVVAMLGVPLGAMVLAAWRLKSQTTMVSTLITFGVVALSCGTCFALFSH